MGSPTKPHARGWRLTLETSRSSIKKVGCSSLNPVHGSTRRISYEDSRGTQVSNFWDDIYYVKRPGYPTQKPIELLERIIKAEQ